MELPIVNSDHEFQFARIAYNGGFEWPRWRADWPEAEHHFLQGLNRLTRLSAADEGVVLTLDDPTLFDYPWVYIVEVGFWSLSSPERDNLREYLLRGGFLMVDDFHGAREWMNFVSVMRSVFPEKSLVKLDIDEEIFNVHYDITERVQIPGIRAVLSGRTWEKGGTIPGWYGLLDEQGRVMVMVNFNQDLGDAWEHADDAEYPALFTTLAYRVGVNYIVYAMTH